MNSETAINVLVAVIAYNEEDSLQKVINELQRINAEKKFKFRVVIFDDCSIDNTCKIGIRNNIEVVRHPLQSGNGMFMISTYLRFAYDHDFDMAVQFDGDNQHLSTYIPILCENLVSKKANIIIGSRYLRKKKFKKIKNSLSKFDRLIGNFIITFTLNKILKLNITDSTSGMRAYDKKAILSLKDSSIDTFDNLTFYNLVKEKDLELSEIQVEMRERLAGSSEFTFLKKLIYIPSLVFSIIFTLINRR